LCKFSILANADDGRRPHHTDDQEICISSWQILLL